MPNKLIILFLLIILIALIFVLTNQEKNIIKSNFNPNSVGKNITEYLKLKESKLNDIKEGVQKRVIWANKENQKTSLSIIYIHGFSASSEEIRPLPDLIAKRLKANLFYTRLKGHGRDAIAMSEASIKYWIDDLHEAIEIGSRIGDKVIVISSSTGGTLSSIASLDKSLSKNILSFIFISPNFGINHKLAKLLTWPLAKYWLKIFIGEMRE
ncbi:MAG: alpha/beta hydrolase, partial [Candidatus Puniceispirillales bacterium]